MGNTLFTENNFIFLTFIAMKFELTKSELGFISDLLAGAQTPGALLAIGNFVGHVSEQVLGYQNQLNELVEGQKIALEQLAKEYFEQDEQGNPKIETSKDPISGQDVQKWVPIEGKDITEFEKLYKEKTDESMKARADLGLQKIQLDVDQAVFFNFKNAVLNDVKIMDVMRGLQLEVKEHQNFTGVLYNVLVSLDSIKITD